MVKEFLQRLIHLEPTVFRTFVVSTVALLVSLGVVIEPSIPDTLVGFVIALSALAQSLWVRSGVTANARVVVEAPDPIHAPHRVVPGEAVTTAAPASIVDAATREREV